MIASWRPGMAAILAGERPVHVVAPQSGGLVAIRPAGDRTGTPLVVRAAMLRRPPGGARLDLSPRLLAPPWRRSWTADQLIALRREWSRLTPDDVSNVLPGRTYLAARLQMLAWWGSTARSRVSRHLSVRATAAALGIGIDAVQTLRREKLLAGRERRIGQRALWTIAPRDLLAFVRAHPEQCRLDWMPPSVYRDAAAQALAADPYLTLTEVGRRVSLTASSVYNRVQDGSLPAIKRYSGSGPGRYLVRASDVGRVWTERQSPDALECERTLAERGLATVTGAAEALGLTASQVRHRVEVGWPVERVRVHRRVRVGIRLDAWREPPPSDDLIPIAAARRRGVSDDLLYKRARAGEVDLVRIPRPDRTIRTATVLAVRAVDLASIKPRSGREQIDQIRRERGLLSTTEAACRLGVSHPTILRRLGDGRLRGEPIVVGRRLVYGVCPNSLEEEKPR